MRNKPQPGRAELSILLSGLLLLIGAATLLAQTREVDLDDLLNRAIQNARLYTNSMRNLTAEETRKTELFDKDGKAKSRVTVSDFTVHTGVQNTLAEYRRVREVDGKLLKDGDKRLEELLKGLSESESEVRELELIDRESSRYDLGDMRMKGMGLNQAWPLEEDSFRRVATFHVEGRESVSGRETWIVSYEAPSELPDSVKDFLDIIEPQHVFVRGRVWIDAEDARIWRSETRTLIDGKSLLEPAVWDQIEFEYRAGPLDTVTPLRIVWTSFSQVSRERSGVKFRIRGRVTANYGQFRRFGTDVQIVPLTPH